MKSEVKKSFLSTEDKKRKLSKMGSDIKTEGWDKLIHTNPQIFKLQFNPKTMATIKERDEKMLSLSRLSEEKQEELMK